MPWTLSLLVWFFSGKFAQPDHFTASAIVQCTLPIQNFVISYRAHIFYYEVVQNYDVIEVFLINDIYHLELSGALELSELIHRCAESELVRYRLHVAKITRTFQQSIKAVDFAHITRDLLKMS